MTQAGVGGKVLEEGRGVTQCESLTAWTGSKVSINIHRAAEMPL